MCTYICSIFSGNRQQSPSKYFLKSERWEDQFLELSYIYLIKFNFLCYWLKNDWICEFQFIFFIKDQQIVGLFLFNDWVDLCSDRIFVPVRDRDTREGKRPVSAMSVNYPVRPYSAMTGHDDDIYDEDQWVSNMSGTTYILVAQFNSLPTNLLSTFCNYIVTLFINVIINGNT